MFYVFCHNKNNLQGHLECKDKIRNINNFKQRGKIQVFNKYMKYTKAISYAL